MFDVAVAADATRVLVMGKQGDVDVALALDRTTGARQWQTTLPGPAATGPRLGRTILLDGPRVMFVRGPTTDRIDALDLASGAHLWSHEATAIAELHWLAPGHLLVTEPTADAVVLDPTGAVTRPFGALHVLCPTPLGVLAVKGGRPRLLTVDEETELPWNPDRAAIPGPCGARGGHLIVATRGLLEETTSIVRIDRRSAEHVWENFSWSSNVRYDPFPALDGDLPRFVPFTTYSVDEGKTYSQLVVIDADEGDYQQYFPGGRTRVVIAGEHTWAHGGELQKLIRIGQTYGKPTTFLGLRGLSAPISFDAKFAQIWLASGDYASPARLPWVRFDLAAATYAANSDLEIQGADAKDWVTLGRF